MKKRTKVKILKTALYASFGALLGSLTVATGVLGITTYHARGNKAVINHIKKDLNELIEKQEKNIGVTQFGSPKIIFGAPIFRPDVYGMYIPESDTIYLFSGNLTTGEKNFENGLAGFVNSIQNFLGEDMPLGDADRTFFHEMGHYYADKLSEEYGLGSWPIYTDDMDDSEIVRFKLVSEGMAEYFEKKSNKNEELYNGGSLKLNDYGFTNVFYYNCGYNLVKPIIDRYGDLGMLYLMNNPPQVLDFKDLTNYQTTAMNFLEKFKD